MFAHNGSGKGDDSPGPAPGMKSAAYDCLVTLGGPFFYCYQAVTHKLT